MANKDTGIVSIHGKEYQTVARRIEDFRTQHPDWTIQSELLSRDNETVVIKSEILDNSGRVISTGFAEESRSASKINKTSAVENAETSAVGRALAFFGMGGTEIASADEVASAIAQQNGDTEYASADRDAMLNAVTEAIKNDDPSSFIVAIKSDERLWSELFSRSLNTKQKQASRDLEQRGVATIQEYAQMLTEAVQRDDKPGVDEATGEMSAGMKRLVWGHLDEQTKQSIRSMKETQEQQQ